MSTARFQTGWTFRSRRHSALTELPRFAEFNFQLSLCACVHRVISDDDFDETRKEGASDDELFEPHSNTRWLKLFLPINNQLKVQCVNFFKGAHRTACFVFRAFFLKKGLP